MDQANTDEAARRDGSALQRTVGHGPQQTHPMAATTVDLYGHGMSWALAESLTAPGDAWTTHDIARAFEDGAKAGMKFQRTTLAALCDQARQDFAPDQNMDAFSHGFRSACALLKQAAERDAVVKQDLTTADRSEMPNVGVNPAPSGVGG